MHGFFSRFLKKFPDSARTLRRTQTLTTVGLFLAIQMVLSSYGVIQLNDSLTPWSEITRLESYDGVWVAANKSAITEKYSECLENVA